MDKILFVRTFRDVGAGGPVPPLGILYLASAIRDRFKDRFCLKIIDTGLIGEDPNVIESEMQHFMPQIVGISTLTCEAEIMHRVAGLAKKINGSSVVIAGGPHPTVASESVLEDKNIDYAVVGEGEKTVVDLLGALDKGKDISAVEGLSYRDDGILKRTKARPFIEDLDTLPFPAWDLIDFKEYARHPNWNGNIRAGHYMPILTSRGCPYHCIYCHNIFGKNFRARSAESVVSEIKYLNDNYRTKEFHVFDDVFNLDAQRVKKICQRLIDSGLKLYFSFPNGLRIDIMDSEMIECLRRMGTYKINYAIETVTRRIQAMIRKELSLEKAKEVVVNTNKAGIITTGYFMLGFPGETKAEMSETINFAVNSDFDLAYFFKVTAFPDTELSERCKDSLPQGRTVDFKNAYFYSPENALPRASAAELNALILEAQKKFYLKPARLARLILKSPYKLKTVKNLFEAWIKILISYIMFKCALVKDVPLETQPPASMP
jgi:radical SAM superfamily enzyme YgiQ (UPF0313 family)